MRHMFESLVSVAVPARISWPQDCGPKCSELYGDEPDLQAMRVGHTACLRTHFRTSLHNADNQHYVK